jgi:ribosomal protein S12 methylthiotransferase accessory factor YcaO
MCENTETNFDKYVMGQTMGKMHVIAVHLWLEHLLVECLKVVVPNPAPLFRDRGMGFAQLVSLCEAHKVVSKALADILRRVNALRNKCAHQLTFNPHDAEWSALEQAIDEVAPSRGNDTGVDSLRRLADHLEEIAAAIGAGTSKLGGS